MKFKLTSSQMNFYNKKFTLDSQIWNQGVMQVFPKVYSYEEINNAYNKLVEAHDSLRVKLVETEDGVVADVREHEHINYRFWQVETEEELMKKAQDFLNEPTDRYGLLVDCAVFNTPTTSGVMINAHHIVVDGYSAFVMSEHINGFLKDKNFAPVIQKYSDYVAKEEKYKNSRRYAKSQEFWLKEFSNKPECNIIPITENTIDFSSAEVNCAIPVELFSKIKELCHKNEITPASFFNAVNATYFHKKYDVSSLTMGVPVFNRTTAEELNTIGLYMHLVPLVINVKEDSFIENAKRIEDSQMNLFRHQSFTQQDIKSLLRDNGVTINQLFDIVSDFQEFTKNDEYEMRLPYGNTLSVPVEMHLQTLDEINHNLKIRYRTAYFTEKEIQVMLNSMLAIAENAAENPEKSISEIEMISQEEKNTILNDFNNTKAEYEKDKCIHQLLEAQVEKTPDKIALVAVNKNLTYKELNEEANRIANNLISKDIGKGDIVGLMLPRKSYLLSALFGILKTGAAYLPIDMELPKERIEYMCQDTNAKFVVSEENIESLLQTEDTSNPNVEMTNEELCYCIYTSGSTGQPKGVMARHRNVVNYISKNEHNIFGKIVKEDFEAIVSISTCSFDIFVTETIATLVNGLKVILADEQACRNQYALNRLLTREKGHFLQTTPTKLKALTKEPGQREFLRSVKAILLGGEAMEWSYLNELKTLTDAKIYNIYGVTEVPIWSAFVDTDTFKDEITIGHGIANTQMYIVDKYMKPTPVGVMGELCIAGDSVSAGYLNKPELTEEKFIDNPFGKGKLYKTGDHAYWREDGNIVFIGRKDFQVKIRGLRIELGEIESVIQAIDGIERAVVVVRKDNEDRQLLCAFYTGEEIEPKGFRTILSSKLPKYMVPHIFTHLEKMPMTASGKANRNALPEIDLNNISTDTEYVAPETAEEKALAEAVEKILYAEKVGVEDNFFDLGGDSLKAIELIAQIEDKGYTVSVKTIFEAINIRELANKLTEKTEKEGTITYDSILPATAAQMRVYTSQMMNPEATHYNIKYAFKAENPDCERLEKAINQLVARHESLRTHFEAVNGTICQVIDEKATVKVEELSEEEILCFTKPFDLNKSPLMYAGCNKDTIVIAFHHIIADGESMPVIFKELNELYMGRELPETVQYGEFAVTDTYTEEDEKYWLDVFSEETTELNLPTDYPRPEKQSFNGTNIYSQIKNELNEKIQDKCKQLGITPYAYYMACYNILLSKYSGNEDICVGMPISGRSSKFLNTVGMFVNTVVLRGNTDGKKTVNALMQEIKENSVSAISHQSFPFGELVKKLNVLSTNRNPLFDVVFAYQGEEMTNILLGDKKGEIIPANTKSVKNELSFYLFPRKEDVVLSVEYNTDLFKEATIKSFIEAYISILTQALNEKTLIKDISVLNEEENRKLLKDFNNTTVEYPRDKCVLTLLEETVKANPYAKAVVAQDKLLTYGELDNESNKLANSLIEKGVGKGDIVGIKLGRTSKFLVSLLGILKTGAVYLPLDPDHPQDRIKTILEDSSAKLCITEENFDELTYNSNTEKPDIKISGDDLCYCIYTSGSTGTPKGAMIQHKNVCWYMHALMSIYGTEPINMPFFTSTSVDLSVPSYLLPLVTGGTTYFYDNDLLVDLADIVNNEEINTIKVTPTHLQIMLQHIEGRTLHNMKYLISGGESLRHADCVEFLEKFGEHIEIHNEYGPTEATVSCVDYLFSRDDTDHIVSIGAPIDNAQIYIVDKYMNLLPLGVTGELCIAGDGVCAGYLNNPELTEEKFVDNPFGEGKLYKTGDLAFWREDGKLTFVGRNDFQVKIRGLRIEIGEIENAVSNVDGVVQCAVVVRTDANDRQFICAFYTGAETKAIDFRTILGTKLPKYMIPHIFTRLDEMPLTSSGKISRNSLPEIDLESISTETEYVSPETDEEKALANAIKAVLNVEEVSMLDNFFNMGGDSITAIYLVSELEDMGYKLQVSDIMQSDTLQDIVKSIRTKTKIEVVDEYKDNPSATGYYDQNEVIGIVPYNPIMRAFLEKSNGVILNDFVHTCIISVGCNEETIRKALDILVSHHDILRGTFVENGIEILPSDEYKAYSFASINIADRDEAIKRLRNTKLDDKFVKAVFCYTKEDCLLSITVHHFLIDLVSWEVLMKDFNTIVKKLNDNEKALLPDKTASFKLWNEELATYLDTMPEENKTYWDSINEELAKSKSFKTSEEINEAEEYHFMLSSEITDKLINKVNKTYDTRLNEVLLTALGLAAGKLAEGSVGIFVESHGRTELHKPIAIEKTIGWFTSCYPVVIKNNEKIAEELVRVKETMRSIPKNGVEYLLLNNGFHNNANIKFNYYKNSVSNENRDNKLVEFNGSSSVFPDMINVSCSVTEDILSVFVTVPECMHKKDISKELGKEFKKQIKKIIEYTDVLPATAAQMRIYTAQVMSSEPTLYNLSSAFKMENFDAGRFENAVNQLIARHEGLRTSFENRNGQIFQIINDTASIKIEKLDSPNLSDFIRPFDLTKAPLMRVGYIDNTVIVDFHHIISDGSTFGIFYEEINELYMGRELPEAVQYREFAVNDTYTKEDEEYWLKEFEEIPDFELYTDFPEQEAKSDKGINLYTKIDRNLHENILIKCKEWGMTPYAYYMGCVSILLSKYSGSEDVCVGVTSNGRSSKFLNTWGMFVNMLSIRTKPESDKTFKDFVNEIKNKSFNAIAHQSYPQQELLKKLNIKKPLYDVMFIYQSEKMTHSVIGDKKAELIPVTISTSRAPIMFYIHPREEDTLLRTEYLTDLFKAETIDKLIASYMSILTQALDAEKKIKDISVLSEEEKEKLLNEFNNTEQEYDVPDNSTLYSLFEKASEENKEKVCLKVDGKELTFKDFKAYAERIDSKIRNITNSEKSVIAVICERSFEMYGAVYGIIRGGNAYLPIDPNYPQERIDYILSNSNAKAVVTQDKFCHLAGNTPCIDATSLLNSTETPEKTEILARPEDTAYVIYTSGSTGNPKGAKISHKSAVNRILWMDNFYPLDENDVILQKTPYTFDVSVWELFWWGIKGRTLCASKPDEHFLPAKILEETNKHKVTHLHFVPSVFDIFLTYLENNPEEQKKFESVKYVFLSGEALTANSIKRFYNIYDYNKVSLHNLYGPTECAVDVSYYACKPTDEDPVPIGKPIYNTQLYVVDKHLNPTPIGVVGELCIGGVNVGQGYLNNEELTKEKFIDNPFHEGKIYKTGDLAYIREDGEIIFCGRIDHQIKLNGQRIELGEIENAILNVDGVESVAVMVKQNNGKDVLVAYCCGNAQKSLVKKDCEDKLPRYMVPSAFVMMDKMPLNASGKLDRKQLKVLPVVFDEYIKEEPTSDMERTVCRIFEKILGTENVGRNESFFDLGGTSIDMISALSESELKSVTASQFIANPTPEKLAELMNRGEKTTYENFAVLKGVMSSKKALILVPYAGGDATAYAKFVDLMAKKKPDMSIYYVDYLHSYEECEKVSEIIAEIGRNKELYIYSHCAGAAVALQIINILEDKGVDISRYITGGYIPPKKASKKNGWNKAPDKYIEKKLVSAGAPLESFSKEQTKEMLDKFRKDTDFMTWYNYSNAKTINAVTDSIISKTDVFTKNFEDAEKLWKNCATNFNRVHFIETDSHYFQSDNSEAFIEIIISIIGK